MKTISTLLGVLFIGFFISSALSAQNQAKPMSNADVVAMVKAALPEDIILSAMDAQETDFDSSAQALVELSKQGVSPKIISAMIAAAKKQKDAAQTAPAAPNPAPPAVQDFTGQPASPPQNAPAPARGAANSNNNSSNETKPGGGGFFGRLNQAQNRVNGAVKQTQGSVEQGQSTVRDAQGTAKQVQGTVDSNGKPAAKSNVAPAGQPNQTRQAAPPQTNNAAPNAAAEQSRAQAADRGAAAQQQRQEQIAAAQKMQEQMKACQDQARAIDSQLRTPEAQKAYTSCVQATVQANTPKK